MERYDAVVLSLPEYAQKLTTPQRFIMPAINPFPQAAERLVQLLKDASLRRHLGENARQSVRQRFLMTRLMEDWFDLIASFQPTFTLKATANL